MSESRPPRRNNRVTGLPFEDEDLDPSPTGQEDEDLDPTPTGQEYDVSYCPECGAKGYERKTKTPEWRCRKCGFEWDAALWEEKRQRYHQYVHDQLQRSWDEFVSREPLWRRKDDESYESLEAERKRGERMEENLRLWKEKRKRRGKQFAVGGGIIGIIVGGYAATSVGAVLVAVLFAVVAYYVGENLVD